MYTQAHKDSIKNSINFQHSDNLSESNIDSVHISPINKVFGGRSLNCLRCKKCGLVGFIINMYRVAKKPGILEKPGIWQFKLKKLEKPRTLNNIYMSSSKISIWHKKSIKKRFHHQFFPLRNTFKVALQYLFNVLYYLTQFFTLNLILNEK